MKFDTVYSKRNGSNCLFSIRSRVLADKHEKKNDNKAVGVYGCKVYTLNLQLNIHIKAQRESILRGIS